MAAPSHTVVKARAARALIYAQEVLGTAAKLFGAVPGAEAVCATYLAFEELVETAKSNKEDLAVLRELCDVVIKSFLRERCSENYSPEIEQSFQSLERYMEGAREIAQECNGRVNRIALSRKISKDIAAVRKNVLDFSVMISVALAHDLHVSFVPCCVGFLDTGNNDVRALVNRTAGD